jgi:glycosyltransferase involved in cell wall biosynthesis
MNITLIGPVYPYRGGIAHYTSHLARKLVNVGYTTQIISFHRQYPSWLYPGTSDKDPSAKPLFVQAEYLLDPIYPWTWTKALNTISHFGPQIVVIQWWTTFWSPAFSILGWMLRNNRNTIIYIIHNVLPHEEKIWDRKLAQFALSKGNAFIVHTEYENERLHEILPSAKSKIFPHPVYDNLAQSRLNKSEARNLLGLTDDVPLLLSFGIVRSYKGLSILLDALEILKKKEIDFRLLIAGEFWEDKKKYLNQIDRLGLDKVVQIIDRYLPDEDVKKVFSAADVLIAPYIGGTQSGVASLGLGFGLPIIVSEKVAAGMADQTGHHVIVTPTGDHMQLARSIETFLNRHQEKQRNHVENILADQSWEHLIEGLVSFGTKLKTDK